MSYWLSTTRPNGQPHAAPVWGVWLDNAFWFGTAGQKIKNLASTPYAVVHLESAEDVVILRGSVMLVADANMLQRVAAAFRLKYVDGATGQPYDLFRDIGPTGPIYRLTPEVGLAWLEGAFATTNTRWTFSHGR